MTKRKQPEAVVGELDVNESPDKVDFQYREETLSRTEALDGSGWESTNDQRGEGTAQRW